MTMYVDTSALLRLVLREPDPVDGLLRAESLVSSEIVAVEAPRTLDRLRLTGALDVDDHGVALAAVRDWLEAMDLILLRPPILARAGHPLPVPLGTLDALHLASALTWQDRTASALVLATHDLALAAGARAYGIRVIGA